MKRFFIVAALAGSSWMLAACSTQECEGDNCPGPRTNAAAGAEPDASTSTAPVACSDAAKDRIGLGGVNLKIARREGVLGADRRRTKPYGVLATELPRVLGNTPPSMAGLGATFGEAPPRWHAEPQPSAVTLSSGLAVAFEGCLTLTEKDAAYALAPVESTATAACVAMGRRFWSRVVSPQDVQGCVTVATSSSASETYATGPNGAPMSTATTPRRRWAYACASLLTATPFLTY